MSFRGGGRGGGGFSGQRGFSRGRGGFSGGDGRGRGGRGAGGFGRGGRGGGGFGRGGRGGWGGGRDEGPPESVEEMGTFVHPCDSELVCKSINTKVPYFNAPIYLENKSQIGKVEEILGPTSSVHFTVTPMQGVLATSFSPGDKVFINPEKLLPLERFLPRAPGASGVSKGRGRGGGRGGTGFGGRRGGSRGGAGGFRGRASPRGGGFRGGRGAGGSGGFRGGGGGGFRGSGNSWGGSRGRGRG